MPELPEVESARRNVERLFLNKKIVEVISLEQGGGPRNGLFDDKILSTGDVSKLLINNCITGCHRKGKYLYFSIGTLGKKSGGRGFLGTLLLHFGMTGSIVIKGETIPTYKSFRVEGEAYPPKFTKLEIKFDGGHSLSFSDPRRLGNIRQYDATADPLTVLPLSKLAIDACQVTVADYPHLLPIISKSRLPLKSLMLDQEGFVSGLGNYLCDEICYQARLHPGIACNRLSEEQIHRMLTKMTEILTIAVDCNDRHEEFPQSWLFHYRWTKGQKQSSSMPDGKKIIFDTIGGRTTAIVPAIQLLTSDGPRDTVSEGKGKDKLKALTKDFKKDVPVPKKRKVTDMTSKDAETLQDSSGNVSPRRSPRVKKQK